MIAQDYAHLPHGSKTLFENELLQIGATRCPREHPDFEDPGPIQRHVFYLGGRPVRVRGPGGFDFVADQTTVSFHNRGDEVRRSAGSGDGDFSHWFALQPELLLPALLHHRQASAASSNGAAKFDEAKPFQLSTGPCTAAAYGLQKALICQLEAEQRAADLWIEESALQLLHLVLQSATGMTPARGAARAPTSRRHRELVEAAKLRLGQGLPERLGLSELARSLGTSSFHLARVFRAQTGWSLHAYRTQLRLVAAVDALYAGVSDLTQLALELGFSSHSHLSSCFKRAFGCTPSRMRLEGSRVRRRR